MKVDYPQLYNMAHLLALNVLLLPKDLTIIFISWYQYLIVGLVFSHLGFWSGNLFLIAPFPDLCLLVPFDLYFG